MSSYYVVLVISYMYTCILFLLPEQTISPIKLLRALPIYKFIIKRKEIIKYYVVPSSSKEKQYTQWLWLFLPVLSVCHVQPMKSLWAKVHLHSKTFFLKEFK